jgi:magnesium chelatase subunit I
VFATFNRHASLDRLGPVLDAFDSGLVLETGEKIPSRAYVRWMREVPGLEDAVERMGTFDASDGAKEPALVASAVELLLEGLHLHRRLNKDRVSTGVVYRR